MKRLFQKNKGYEPTPFVTDTPPSGRDSLGTDHSSAHPRPSVGSHPTPSSRQSPDPQHTLETSKPHHAQPPAAPALSAASAKKWFTNLNGKGGAGYDQITPFTMPHQPGETTESSTSVDRHSWHDHAAGGRQGNNKYEGEGLGHPTTTGRRVDPEGGLVPPPATEQGGNMKRRVSLRDHASGRMFGWSSRDKHKERERKPGAGADVVVVQPSSSPGAKVISGQRYEDTAYPSSGPVPVGKGYGQVYSPSAVNMSRGTTQSAELAERRGSSASQGRHEYPQFPPHDALLSPTGGNHLPPPLPLSQQHSRSSQQSIRQQYPQHPGAPLASSSPGFQANASPAGQLDPNALQRPISMAKLNADTWSPASSEHELLVPPRDQLTGGQPSSSPAALASMPSPRGRDHGHLASPPPVLAESARPASPLHQRVDTYNYTRPSVDQGADQHWYGTQGEHSAEDGKNHHHQNKKKGLFGFVVGGATSKDKSADREKDKPSDWAGFLRKKEPRIEYRGPEYTDHTTMTDASYSEVMPVAYAGIGQHVKVLEMPKRDREQAIRDAQERTREAQRTEKQRVKEEERRMKDEEKRAREEEKRAREEEKERTRLEKEQARKAKDDGKAGKGTRDPKSVSFEIDELCKTAYASDLSKIYNIGDKLSRCDKAVHKEAVHATRKQIKHGATPEAKIFAMKIWLLISDFDRSDSGFRVLSFEKKFLAAVEDQLLDTEEESKLPQATFDRMRDTLSHLSHHYGRLPGGENLRHSWQKVKRPDEPQDGYSFPETHPVFSPQDPLLRPSPASSSNQLEHLNTILPNEIQQLTKLVEECKEGNAQARALQEALLLDNHHLKKAEINQMYAACVQALEELESQMSWANTQAEKSRLERGLSTPADFGLSFEDQLSGHPVDPKSGNDDLPLAERAFGDLLAASDALTNAIKLYEDAERASRENMELRYAQEKSKVDTRMGRSSHEGGLFVPQGNSAYAGGSASRSPSPSRTFDAGYNGRHQDNARHAPTNGAHSPYSNGVPLSRTPTTAESLDMPPPRFPDDGRPESPPRNGTRVLGPRPFRERGKYGSSTSLQSSQQHHSSSQKNNFVVRNGTDDDDDEEALSRPPPRPSAKALGKRPAKETSTFDPDDIWKVDEPKRPESPPESDTSFEDWLLRKPEKYVYDAMQDKEVQRQLEESRKKKTDQSRRKTLEAGYGGSQYISTGMNAQLAEIKKALGKDAPSKSPAGSRDSSRAASPVPEHAGLLRTTSSRWKWRK